jgi:hypothetical protein
MGDEADAMSDLEMSTQDAEDFGERTWTCRKCDAIGFPPMMPTKCVELGCPMKEIQ